MRIATTYWLLFVALLLLGGVWLMREHRQAGEPSLWRDRPLLSIGPREVSALSIQSGELDVRLERHAADWFLVRPLRARADVAAVERILALLDMTLVRDAVTLAQRRERELSFEDYGLGTPQSVFTVEAGPRQEGFMLGAPAPLGRYLFARRMRSEDVLMIEPDVLKAVPASIDELRDRSLVPGRSRHVRRLDIQAAGRGFMQLVRQDGGWRLQQPMAAAADEAAVQRMLTALFNLQVARFYWDPNPDAGETAVDVSQRSQYEACGLSEDVASLRIGVWIEGDDLGQEVFFGSRPADSADRVYARRRDVASIYEVDASLLDAFTVAPDSLRDRRVFLRNPDEVTALRIEQDGHVLAMRADGSNGRHWMIREPGTWKADPDALHFALAGLYALRVRRYRDAASLTNAEAAGLSPPATRITVGYRDDQSQTLLVGAPVGDLDEVWASSGEDGPPFTLIRSDLRWLHRQGVDPLRYRDRMLLELPPDSVWRITRTSAAGTQQVERVEGAWRVTGDAGGTPRTLAAEAIVAALRALRAESIEVQNPPEPAVFGLDDAALALTVGLRGDAGIQKTLYFGFLSTSGGVYARLRGQDIVFILDRATVDTLTAPLVASPATARTADGTP